MPDEIRAPNCRINEKPAYLPSAREACVDHLPILPEQHLARILATYVSSYTRRRPHQGLGEERPLASARDPGAGPVQRRDLLGGIIHDYSRAAA